MTAPVSAYGAMPSSCRVDLLELVVGVDVDDQDRAEVLGREHRVGRVRRDHDGRPHEPADLVVGLAADHDVELGLTLGSGDRGLVLGERPLVDDRAHEVGEVGDVAHRQRLDLGEERVLHPVPHRPGDVGPRCGRALLALELERAADQRGAHDVRVRRRVGEHEVLAAGLADDPRV